MKFFKQLLLISTFIVTFCFSNFAITQQSEGNIASSEIVPRTLAEGIKLREAERRATLAEVKYREAQSNYQTAELKIKTEELVTDGVDRYNAASTSDLPTSTDELNAYVQSAINEALAKQISQLDASSDEESSSAVNLDDIKVVFWMKDTKPARAILSAPSLGITGTEIHGAGKLAGLIDIKVNAKEIVASYKGVRRTLTDK